jgi:nitrogen fixation-related uncharacterized protein
MFRGAVVFVLLVALALTAVLGRGSVLMPVGLGLVGIGVFLFFWDSQKNEDFSDDWVDAAQAGASLACVAAGLTLAAIGVV